MKIIGITGPSGSGKTTVSKIIEEEYNAFIIDADKVAKDLSSNQETTYFRKIIELFGNEILKDDENLDRLKLAKIIYSDDLKRKALNDLTFKYVVEDILNQIEELRNSNFDYIVIDVPLLYEAKMEKICDTVIAVIAEDSEKIIRICIRDNISQEAAERRLEIQNNNEFFTKKADFVINNDFTIESLIKSLKEIMKKI